MSKEDTKWRLRDTEGKEYIIIDSQKVDLQEELNKTIVKQMKEIERLNNIINELEKRLEQGIEDNIKEYSLKSQMAVFVLRDTLELIEELKGSDKEC